MTEEEKQEAKERTKRCMDKIMAILKEERCTLESKLTIIGNQITSSEIMIYINKETEGGTE